MITKLDSLCLRYYIEGDEDEIFEYTNDIQSSKYLARLRHESKSQTKDMLQRLAVSNSLTEIGKCIWLIADAFSQKAIGYLTLVKDGSSVELHIGLVKKYTGKGNGKKAIMLATQHLLQDMKFTEVVSFTDVTHIAAKSAFEKSGFSVVSVKKEFYVAPQLSGLKRDVFWLRCSA